MTLTFWARAMPNTLDRLIHDFVWYRLSCRKRGGIFKATFVAESLPTCGTDTAAKNDRTAIAAISYELLLPAVAAIF
jgi:hypothetical protein